MSIKPKFCSECGASLEENDHFCPICGAKVVDEQNHEKSPAKNASTPPPPKKSKPQATPYVSRSSVEGILSSSEEGQILHKARFSYRIGAMIIDWSLVGLIGLGAFLIVVFIDEFVHRITNDDAPIFIFLIIVIPIVTSWYYNSRMEASKLQTTIGKYLFGLRVTNKKGFRCSLGCTKVRFIGKLISLALGGLGYLMIAFTKDKQALHDKLAKTLVIEGEIKVNFMKKILRS